MKNRIAFIDHSYHIKTKSSDFFLKILQNYFAVDIIYDNSCQDNNKVDINMINKNNYFALILWQIIYEIDYLEKLNCNNIIFIPMYDGMGAYRLSGNIDLHQWKQYKKYKFMNFSKYVNDTLKNNEFENTLNIQYAEVSNDKQVVKRNYKRKYKILFWQRRNEITWNTLKKLLDSEQIQSIHIHKAVDPNTEFICPSENEIKKFNITFSDWFETKDEYLKKLENCDICIVPRSYEGIGMSFIEAMAKGKCVISPNHSTMNEYIVHNENGLLYDLNNPSKLNISNALQLGENAQKTIQKVYTEWLKDEKRIIDFIKKGQNVEERSDEVLKKAISELYKISFLKNPIKKLKAYKKMIDIYHQTKEEMINKENKRRTKLLIVFPHNPFLLQNGVQARFYRLLEYFKSRNISVDILSHSNFVDTWSTQHLNHTLVNNVYLNDFKSSKIEQKLNKSESILPNFAFSSLKKQFQQLLKKNRYDAVLISYVHWAEIVKDVKNIKKYITIEDFISINNYERHNGNYNLGQSINEEIDRINLFDKAICISQDEMNFFERVRKDVDFQHIPHFLEKKFSDQKQKTIDILFVGSDNPFNKDGMIWFFEKVMLRLNINLKIKIVGRVNEYLDNYKKKYTNVEFINYVNDLDEIYKETKITICPLQAGTGLKIKVVEALSFGLPVVATKYGVVGMDARYNGCIVVDDEKEFASSIELLLHNKEKYTKYQKEAQDYFTDNFSEESIYKKLDKIFIAS